MNIYRRLTSSHPTPGYLAQRLLGLGLILTLLLAGAPVPTANAAPRSQADPHSPPSPLTVANVGGDVRIAWQLDEVLAADAVTAAESGASDATTSWLDAMPRGVYQGYALPLQTVAVRLPEGVTAELVLSETPDVAAAGLDVGGIDVGGVDWSRLVTPAPRALPEALYEELPNADDLTALWTVEPALPTASVFLLREGRMRGKRIAVYAISPLYQPVDDSGVEGPLRLATTFNATIPGAQMLTDGVVAAAQSGESSLLANTQPVALDATPPTNPYAAVASVKITVSEVGVQRITGAMLAEAGLRTDAPDKLRLLHRGQEVALEVRDANSNGQLDAEEEVRFLAGDLLTGETGDRWNTADIYWMAIARTPGLRMERRSVAVAAAPARRTAVERGLWQERQQFISLDAGFDGDYFFAADMKTPAVGSTGADDIIIPSVAAQFDVRLPLANSEVEAAFTVRGTAFPVRAASPQHTLRLRMGTSRVDVPWQSITRGSTRWAHDVTVDDPADALTVALLPGAQASHLLLEQVEWTLPVALNFGERGAAFRGVAGDWAYGLSGTPAGRTLYDVTERARPQILPLPSGAETQFQDGPDVRDYLVAGPGTLHTPTVARHVPVAFPTDEGAHALYIAPAEFMPALEPLLAHRRAQRYTTTAVDVQAIYDAWGDGYVSPAAIRQFLQFAVANWSPAPISVVLVGDGTWDPKNFISDEHRSDNFIPPYMAEVDPFVNAVPCDNCYFQLDGSDPTNSEADPDFLADIWGGRLPVKSAEELTSTVDKIIRYETATDTLAAWRYRTIFVADDYERCDGTFDLAGDFVRLSEEVIELLPTNVRTKRLYYTPTSDCSERGRTSLARAIRERTIEAASQGAGLFTFQGHANTWQIARLDYSVAEPSHILGMFDTDRFTNRDELFIALQMTCLTAQFAKPAASGTVFDERLLLNPDGGAVAVWGPTGLSVVQGHDWLQRGFHEALWQLEQVRGPLKAPLGELTQAGYTSLFTSSSSGYGLDPLRTFVLLGDPLTRARVYAPETVSHLPIIGHQPAASQ